ncbi:MAG: hydantoinase/oxoprolinase family protein, partial [Bryobacteraceae bacterium]
LCFGVDERSLFDGTVLRAPAAADLDQLRRALREARVESVAICFLHSCQNPANERAAAEALGDCGYLSVSHKVCPEYREYERASTTAINAYVGPLMDRYLARLEGHSISILQSSGGFMTAGEARRNAVRTVLSGPAGGVVGAMEVARQSGFRRVLAFDMGGTSTDVSLADGRLRHTLEGSIDTLPLRLPILDIHTVGAGGGSIARVDAGGLLRVGPESAGAIPGPACYGTGDRPTVTDAHVVLGRIAEAQFLGGEMAIDPRRSEAAIDRIAAELQLGRVAAAEGIIRVANANMERAIRVPSVERGHDPRDFALLAFGGCGGLHACDIAAGLGITTVIVPRLAGALSALGMLLADRVRDYSVSALGRPKPEALYRELERTARRDLPGARLERSADLRYAGQSYELTVAWRPPNIAAPFHREHLRVYGYSDRKRAVELVTLRVRAVIPTAKPRLAGSTARESASEPDTRRVRIDGQWRTIPALSRDQIPKRGIKGPALVIDYGSTTLAPAGWRIALDRIGSLIVRR